MTTAQNDTGQTAADLDELRRRAQSEAMHDVANASLTLGEAEAVFTNAVGLMATAIHGAVIVGVPLDEIKRRARANDRLHSMARGHISLLIDDERKHAELSAAATVEADAAEARGH